MTEKDYKKELKDKLIKYRSTLNLPSDVTFGVEIEYANIVKDTVSYLLNEEQSYGNLKDWKSVSECDITLYNKYGEEENGEIISPILKDNIKTWKDLRNILDLLRRNEGVITNRCGGHISIGTQILGDKKEYYRNFFLIWLLYENEIYKFSSGEFNKIRKDVRGLFRKVSLDMKLSHVLNTDNKVYLDYLKFLIFDKCHAVYIWSDFTDKLVDGNRIEFRIPNGSLNEEIWQNNINFFSKLLLACKKDLDIEKMTYNVINNNHNMIDLANLVFDNDIDKENFLIQGLKTNKVYKKELIKHSNCVIYK